MTKARIATALALAAGLAASPILAQPAPPPPAPQARTAQASEQERQRELALLHLARTRPGVSNRDPAAPDFANYDEAKANPWPLPDPLTEPNGRRVTTAAQWWSVRRPQILKAATDALYGRVPAGAPRVTWSVTETRRETQFGVPVVAQALDGRLDNTADPAIEVHIQALKVTPQAAVAAHRKTPVILAIDFARRPPGLPADPGVDYRQQVLERGWSYVVYDPTTVQPDNGAGLTRGVIGLANRGQPRSLDDWGALRAWAWGASRILDRLALDPAVDAAKVAIFGHSRYGKAALVAMAYDPRFAMGFIICGWPLRCKG